MNWSREVWRLYDNGKNAGRFKAHYDPNGEDAIQKGSSARTREILGPDEIRRLTPLSS